jgi:hypothetical protein
MSRVGASSNRLTGVMSKAKLEDLPTLFGKLQTQLDNEAYEQVVQTTAAILAQAPGDEDATQIQCAAFIKLARFADAVATAQGSKAPGTLMFEHIYALYRLRKFDDAARLLATVPDGARHEGFLHLEAQIAYQSGQYARAVEIFEKHFVNRKDLDAELKTNICAAFVSANQAAKIPVRGCANR